MMAKEMDMVTPRIFSDAAFVKSTHWRLSTSQVSTKSDCFMIYGPAVKNGYGCCYNLRAINMNFGITSYSSYPNTVPEKFRVALEESLNEMYDICCKFAKKHPPKKEEPKNQNQKSLNLRSLNPRLANPKKVNQVIRKRVKLKNVNPKTQKKKKKNNTL
ncbi:choline O-acetyltransferase-like [Ctenocephalides felis]|uniref:choline O-acetyltransferase-like n=1 Tax=Ctenocephalides felis TaxID=7515 RepID=UPI000E6E5A58|nr:choline O-acetyltransferase-like [Ctenocephalides felis]